MRVLDEKWDVFTIGSTIGVQVKDYVDICNIYTDKDGNGRNDFDSTRTWEESLEIAERIAACVNACMEIETEDLKKVFFSVVNGLGEIEAMPVIKLDKM